MRGGYGVYYNLLDRMGSEDQLSLNPPFLVNFNFTNNTITPAATFATGFGPGTLDPATVNLTQVQLRAANPNSSTSYIQQYSIGVQRQFAGDWRRIATWAAGAPFTLRDHNSRYQGRPIPYTRAISVPAFGWLNTATQRISNYNSMEATLDKRFHRGYTIRAVYTLSKSLDNSFEHLTSGGFKLVSKTRATFLLVRLVGF